MASFFSYEDILHDFYKLIYNDDNQLHPAGTKNHINKDNALVWLLLQLFCKFTLPFYEIRLILVFLVIDIDRVSTNVIEKDFEKDERLFEKLVKLYNEDQMMTKDGFSLRDLSLQCAVSTRSEKYMEAKSILVV